MRDPVRLLDKAWAAARARTWPAHSRLLVAADGAGWVLSEEARELRETCRRLGVAVAPARWQPRVSGQCVFSFDHFDVLLGPSLPPTNRVAVAYLHGLPGTHGYPEFDRAFEGLRARHRDLARVQVSHRQLHDLVLESGIDADKVFLIPLGINTELFRPAAPGERAEARARLGLPADAFVVGSLQKDGVGWGTGDEPKLIKGPDVLLAALAAAKARIPELHVALIGPSRGFVRRGLDELDIPYVAQQFDTLQQVAGVYPALDACIVASRQEGGPKAVLEAMSSGVPLVTTHVGQAADLVRHGENGWMVDSEDADGLAEGLVAVSGARADVARWIEYGRRTAEENSYVAQLPLWRAFMNGFVEVKA
jgi:glycosyltransferase involved in cell wall biosynthesis